MGKISTLYQYHWVYRQLRVIPNGQTTSNVSLVSIQDLKRLPYITRGHLVSKIQMIIRQRSDNLENVQVICVEFANLRATSIYFLSSKLLLDDIKIVLMVFKVIGME